MRKIETGGKQTICGKVYVEDVLYFRLNSTYLLLKKLNKNKFSSH